MPFKSEKQRRYLYSQKPEVAKKFAVDSAKKGKIIKLRGGGMDMGNKSNQAQSASMAGASTGQTKTNNQTSRPNPHTNSGVSNTSNQKVNFAKNKQSVYELLRLTKWYIRLLADPKIGFILSLILKPIYLLKKRIQNKPKLEWEY